jgi:LCP family protein required for cell wall assembly
VIAPDPAAPRGQGRHTVVRRVLAGASVLTLAATALSGAGWLTLNRLTGNITTVDVSGQLGVRPAKVTSGQGQNQPVNILVMGTDTRTGQGSGYGSAADTSSGNGHSDTTILFHISGDRQHAIAVSIPRDSYVTRPSCSGSGSVTGRINTAFAEGGAGCAIKAVEKLTGVFIDHYVVVNFNGFKSVVDALGGVEVCLPTAVNDSKSHLDLSAGRHLLSGDQALAYARLRHGIGDGSDIGRIGRQQDFLSSVIQAATSKGLLLDPTKLYSVLNAVTGSLTTDPDLGKFDYDQSLAQSLASIPTSNITFVTVPWVPRSDHATISWNTTEADKIWTAIKDDTAYGKPAATTAPAGQPALTVAPKAIRVRVLNGTGTAGAASKAASALRAAGFDVVGVGNAPGSPVTASTITYPTDYTESARTLAFATSIATSTQSGSGRVLTVVVGPDWTGKLAKVTVATKAPSSSPAPAVKTANENICAA